MRSEGTTNRLWVTAGAVALVVVFLADALLPLGVVTGPLYVLVALLSLRASARSAIVCGSVATAANVLAYALAPAVGIPEWMVGASRVLTVFATWLLIVIGIHLDRRSRLVINKMRESNARLRLASEAAELGFWSNDLSTGDLMFDDCWMGVLGYSPDEIEYTAAWYERLVHPDDRSNVELAWRKHLSGQTSSFEVEHRLMAKNGGWRRILSKGRVVARDAAGTPLRTAGTQLDVTATRDLERQAEQALRDRHRELQLVTDAIPMMIGYLDDEECLQFVNKACATMFGLDVEDIKGKHLRQLVGASTYERLSTFFASALRGDRVQFEEAVTVESQTYWWLAHLLPRKDVNRRVLGFYMLVTDVTGVKQFEEEVEKQREALAHHNRRGVANEMAAAIAHELNQPLATISVYASELRKTFREGCEEPEEVERGLALIDREAQRAGQIMRKVRDMVDNRKPRTVATDLRKLLESVRQVCEIRARSARAHIELLIDDSIDYVHADRLQLQQVLVNLVNNAIDASLDVDESRKQIAIHVSSEAGGVHIRVVDSGQGLSGRHLKRVFSPYYTTKPDGLGIGLNICQSIISAHGGKLWASRNEPAGAIFHLLLPHDAAVESPPTSLSAAL